MLRDTQIDVAEGALHDCGVTLLRYDASLPFDDDTLYQVSEHPAVIVNVHVDDDGERWLRQQVLMNLCDRVPDLDATDLEDAIERRTGYTPGA